MGPDAMLSGEKNQNSQSPSPHGAWSHWEGTDFHKGSIKSHGDKSYKVEVHGELPGGSVIKNPPAVPETWVQSLVRKDPLEEEIATHSSILAWEIPLAEEPDRL